MNINQILRFSSQGWTFEDVGLKVYVAPRTTSSRVTPIEEESQDNEDHSSRSTPLFSYRDSVSISQEAKIKGHYNPSKASAPTEAETSEKETKEIQELSKRDQEVKRHEMAHKAAGGSYAGQPVYEYEQGPDGKRYAVGGHVSIDVSPEDTPEETIQKAQVIKRASQAPQDPSTEDRQVAQKATQMEQEARQELSQEDPVEKGTSQSAQEVETSAAQSETLANSTRVTSHVLAPSLQPIMAPSPQEYMRSVYTASYASQQGAQSSINFVV